jgi:hypothetical protein
MTGGTVFAMAINVTETILIRPWDFGFKAAVPKIGVINAVSQKMSKMSIISTEKK